MTINRIRHDAVRLVAEIRQLPPVSAAALFAVGWITGALGSLVALLIIVALLAGILLARVPSMPQTVANKAPAIVPTTVNPSPLADALAAGLTIRKVEFAQTSQTAGNGRAKSV